MGDNGSATENKMEIRNVAKCTQKGSSPWVFFILFKNFSSAASLFWCKRIVSMKSLGRASVCLSMCPKVLQPKKEETVPSGFYCLPKLLHVQLQQPPAWRGGAIGWNTVALPSYRRGLHVVLVCFSCCADDGNSSATLTASAL